MFRFERTYAFAVPPEQLWRSLARIEAYRDWWPWLRSVDGDGLVAGGVSTIAIWAPVPWIIRLRLTVTRVVEGELVEVDVDGDLAGPAALEISPGETAEVSRARLRWHLAPASPGIRLASRLARPVLQSGQDWVVSVGVGQFRRRAFRDA